MYSIYIHIFPNNKVYIGMTKQNIEKRWQSNGAGYKSQPLVYNAIKKYGWNNIKHEVLFTNLTLEEANKKEQELIKQYQSTTSEFGYNIRDGGFVADGWHHSKETIKKLRQINRGKPTPNTTGMRFPRLTIYQYNLTGELIATYKGLHQAAIATNKSESTISCCINNQQKQSGNFIFSKAPLSPNEIKIKYTHNPTRPIKSVYQYDYTGQLVCIYKSLKAAAEITGFNRNSIQCCCKNHRKTYNKFVWSYVPLSKSIVLKHYIIRSKKNENKN